MKLKLLIVALFCSVLGWGQVNLAAGGTYNQNFDGLGTTSIGTYTNNTTLAGWYITTAGLPINTGTTNANSCYNFGALGTNPLSDRALGAISTATTHRFGLRLLNNGASDITSFNISFTGEQWRSYNAGNLVFEYQTGATVTSITAGTWTALAALNFSSLATSGGAAMDGNAPANRTAVSATLTVNVPAGTEIFFRWSRIGSSSPGLAIDDLSVVANGGCSSAAITTQPSTTVQNLCQGSAATALSVTATGTTLTYQWYSNTTATTSGGTPVGTSSNSYTPVTTAAGTLYYYCIVSAACGASVTSNVSGAVNVTAIPSAPSGTINISANPSCGAATLTYSAPSANIYWQTTAGGTSTTNPTTSSYTSSATAGSYTIYVRELNGSCWSPATSVDFTVVAPVNITAQPPNRVVNDGVNTTFTVSATGTGLTFQWQVDTGSGFNNITLAAPYSELTTGGATKTSTLTITNVPLSMNGYLYRCIVSGASPCGSVTSNSGSLTVNAVPEIDVVGNGISITDGDTTASTADDTDFGATDVASGTITKTFTIRNTGSANLTISSVTSSFGEFVITTPPAATVVPGSTTTFQVTFNPTTTGIRFATITINNNDSNENPYTFEVNGRGTEPEMNVQGNGNTIPDNDTTPVLTDNTNFGTVALPGTIVQTFTIQNTASGVNASVLNLTGTPIVAISGADAPDFTVTTFPTTPVATSGSTTFQITFNPSTVGVKNAVVTIANDDSNENPYNFNITATATDTPNIVLSSANPAVASSNIVQSVNNHVIYAFDLTVTTFDAVLNNVVFNTSGSYAASSITNFKLWYSTDAVFNSATDAFLDNETATLGVGSHTFTGFSRTINIGTTGYFFITTDIPCTSTSGSTIVVDPITIADLTFVAGNKSGTAFVSGTHTIQSAIPNNVTGVVTSVCENGTATISWTAPAGCRDNVLVFATNGTFTAAIPTGNGGTYTDNAVFGSGTTFDGGFTVFKGTGTSVTVTGLTNGTTYRFKIFTRNDLNWSNGVEVSCTPTLAYCASGSTSSGDSEIENVVLNGENNSINNNTTNVCTTGVNNYTAMSADLQVGGAYTITVEFGDCNGGTQYDGAGGVWIDWNNDGDFLDTNETIGTALVAVSGGNVIQNFTINVPIAQSLGFYRMRIVQTEGGTLGTISPCGTFSWGSTEDYTIEVINACTPTTSVSSIFPTSGPVGTVVTINGSGFTTATSVSFGSVVASFNIISNTVIEVIVPTGVTTGNIVIQDAGSCNLSYSSFTVITKDVSSCEGAPVTTDLIIYELHDEQSGDGGFITLYNGTAATINLSDYSIYRAGDYGAAMSNYATLTGSIAPGALGVVTVDAASCGNATNGDLNAGFNENDQIQLRNAAGTVVIDDVQAYIPGPGYYMVRNAGALSARTTFVAADWTTTPLVAGQCIPSAGLVPPSGTGDSPDVTLNPLDVNASCSSSTATLSVAGTEGVAGGASLAYQWYVNVPGNAGWTAVANGGVYSGATTTTLNISSTSGLNNYQYYCQIRENDATCYTATEAAIVKEGATIWDGTSWSNGVPTLTKLAIINGNYDTTANGNFSCCSLIVNASFVLDIRANDYVEIQNDLTVNGTLNVLNNGSLVQISDAGINTGNISYQRIASVKLQDYVYWSSPVSGFDVNSISPATPAYYHWEWNPTILNPNGGEGNWVNASTTMLGGKGYIVRAPNGFSNTVNQNWTATFNNGVPNNGVYTPTIARGTDLNAGTAGPNGVMRTVNDDNWNLLGNPYPSAISIGAFLTANPQLDGFVRLWTHGTLPTSSVDPFYNNFTYNYSASDYIAINGAGATSGPGTLSVIGAGQGFFVLMNPGAATTTTATFNNAMRNIGYANNQFYRSANVVNSAPSGNIERHRIWLDLVSPTNQTTRTLVAYVEGATEGKDRMFDALTDYKSAQNFYSLIDDQVMTIQGKGLPFYQDDKVPLGIKIASNGIYKIAIGAIDGLFEQGQNIYLEDKLLGIIHDLRQAPYTFTGTSGIVNNRFVLRFTNETLGNDDFETLNDSVIVTTGNELTVSSLKESIKEVIVYDVLGRLINRKSNINALNVTLSDLNKTNNALIIYVVLDSGKQVVKKIIY